MPESHNNLFKNNRYDIIDESRTYYRPTTSETWIDLVDVDVESLLINDERELTLLQQFRPSNNVVDEQEQVLSQGFSQLSTGSSDYDDSTNDNNKRQRQRQRQQENETKSNEQKKLRIDQEETIGNEISVTIPIYMDDDHPIFNEFLNEIKEIENFNDSNLKRRLQICGTILHQIEIIKMHQELWTFYLQMGLGEYHLNPVDIQTTINMNVAHHRYWPNEVRKFALENEENPSTSTTIVNIDQICLKIVDNRLQKIREKLKYLRTKYDTMRMTKIEHQLQCFVKNYGHSPNAERLKGKMTLVKFDYLDDYLQNQYRHEQLTDEQIKIEKQIFDLHQQYEKTRCDWLFNRQRILSNQLNSSYDKLDIGLPQFLQTFMDQSMKRRYIHEYKHLVETVNTKLTLSYLEMLEYQMEQDRQYCEQETNRLLLSDPIQPTQLKLLMTKRLENSKQRWIYRNRFAVHYYLQHNYDRFHRKRNPIWINDGLIGFLSNICIDPSFDYSFNRQQLALLDRGPSYVTPYQLKLCDESLNDERLLAKQYAPFHHRLAHTCQENQLNLIQMTTIQSTSKRLFQQIFSMPITSRSNERSIYEHSIMKSIRNKIDEEKLILRRLADNSNRFYLGGRVQFEQLSKQYLKQSNCLQHLYDIDDKNIDQIKNNIKQRLETYNQKINDLFKQKRFNEEIYQQLQVKLDKIKIPYVYFLPIVDDDNHLKQVQPFLSSHQCLTWKLSSYLHQLLRSLVRRVLEKTNFLNQSDFNRKLSRYTFEKTPFRSTTRLIKITVKNLDTSISHSSLTDIVGYFLFDNLPTNKHEGVSIDTIKQLTKLFLDNNFFYYEKKLYQYTKGFPKQTLLATLLTNIYLFVWERVLFNDNRLKQEFFGRYNNEIIFTWNYSIEELNRFIESLHKEYHYIHFDVHHGKTMNYLDTLIENRNGRLYTCFQQQSNLKPNDIRSYMLPYMNGNSIDEHRRWLRSILIRTVHACTNHEDFQRLRIALEFQYLRNGYSIDFIDYEFKQFYHYFNADRVRYIIDEGDFNRLRRRCLDYIDHEQGLMNKYWQFYDKHSLLNMYYLYDHGSYEEFNEKFLDDWNRLMQNHPKLTTAAHIHMTAKTLFSLNTFLSQSLIDRPSFLQLKQ